MAISKLHGVVYLFRIIMNHTPKVILATLLMTGITMNAIAQQTLSPEAYKSVKADGKFRNTNTIYKTGSENLWEVTKAYITAERKAAVPAHIPVELINETALSQTDDALFRLTHSTQLLRLDNQYVLTDPVFSERASFVQWLGPKRFHKMPITIEQLPPLTAVVISHDHYDHLDRQTLKALDAKTKYFIMPLGVSSRLKGIVSEDKIIERDWWQSVEVDSLEFIATPAQHFSGRGLFDRDETLWASWVINSSKRKVFFSGDTGYFDGFKTIGEKYGPFDLTMIETGAYNDLWSDIHMTPEESVQAHIDLQGTAMLPIHNSAFDLALHDWYEPLERASDAARKKDVTLLTPVFGQQIKLDGTRPDAQALPQYQNKWWRDTK